MHSLVDAKAKRLQLTDKLLQHLKPVCPEATGCRDWGYIYLGIHLLVERLRFFTLLFLCMHERVLLWHF